MSNPATVRAAFAFEPLLCKGEAPMPKGQKAPMKRVEVILLGWLREQLPVAIAWATAQLGDTVTVEKMTGESFELLKSSPPDFDAGSLFDDLARELTDAAFAGVADVAASVGVDLLTAPEAAVTYARERAAQLVGKRVIAGIPIDNPNPQFAISETMRDVVRNTVAKAISEGWSPQDLTSALQSEFGDWRAETIARTETGYSYGNAAAEGYVELGVELLEIVDGPGCLPDGHDDNAGAPSGERGEIEEGAQANGQVWTVAQYQEHILGHPSCVRAAVPAAAGDPS